MVCKAKVWATGYLLRFPQAPSCIAILSLSRVPVFPLRVAAPGLVTGPPGNTWSHVNLEQENLEEEAHFFLWITLTKTLSLT